MTSAREKLPQESSPRNQFLQQGGQAIFHSRRAILIQKHIQQQNHIQLYTEKGGSAIHPPLNGAISVLLLSQWKADELQELFDNFSLYNLLTHCKN